jgi:hypothetical protein
MYGQLWDADLLAHTSRHQCAFRQRIGLTDTSCGPTLIQMSSVVRSLL